MPRVGVYSQDEAQEMARLYESGLPCREVAKRYNLCESAARRYIISTGTPMRPRGGNTYIHLAHEEYEKTIFLYERMGWTTGQIAQHLGLATSTICARLSRAGIRTRPRSQTMRMKFRNLSREERVARILPAWKANPRNRAT